MKETLANSENSGKMLETLTLCRKPWVRVRNPDVGKNLVGGGKPG
jgi:head-tail adaptor